MQSGFPRGAIWVRISDVVRYELGPDWTPEQIAEKGAAYWADAPNFGKRCLTELRNWLAERGLRFSDEPAHKPPYDWQPG